MFIRLRGNSEHADLPSHNICQKPSAEVASCGNSNAKPTMARGMDSPLLEADCLPSMFWAVVPRLVQRLVVFNSCNLTFT